MDDDEINDLRDEFLESKKMLLNLDREIERLKLKAKYGGNAREYYMKNQKILSDNRKLKREHQQKLRRIQEYNNQLDELKSKFLTRNTEMQK